MVQGQLGLLASSSSAWATKTISSSVLKKPICTVYVPIFTSCPCVLTQEMDNYKSYDGTYEQPAAAEECNVPPQIPMFEQLLEGCCFCRLWNSFRMWVSGFEEG